MKLEPEHPDRIWLSPICDENTPEGRMWCAEPETATCDDCGEPWIEYRRTPPASQSDEALINVGPINRIPGSDSIRCPGLPSGMMCLGWGEQGWAINDKDGKRIAAGNWGECATLPASQSEALVDLIAHELAEWLEWKDAMEAATAMLRIAKLERAEGKREGIEEAAKVAEGVLGVNATAIRALAEKQP